MPSRKDEAPIDAIDAMEDLRELLADLEDHGAEHDELDLLNEVLGDPEYQALGEMHDILTSRLPDPHDDNATDILHDSIDLVAEEANRMKKARELVDILEDPHIMSLIYTHDDVARKMYDDVFPDAFDLVAPPPPVFDAVSEQHRYVTIRKNGKQPLGITVRLDEANELAIARILQDSLADKQQLLNVGDIIKEVNGIAVFVPEDMMIVLKEAEESITFKIVPTLSDKMHSNPVFMKACFNYDPLVDRLIPCKKAGLPFREGDILDVVDVTDENWWQAKHAENPGAPVGLIPSRTLQEKRGAYVQPELTKTKTSLLCGIKTKRKKKIGYNSNDTTDFDKCDIKVYEMVERSKKHRSSLVLVGASGVGRRSLKERLIRQFPEKYGAAIPHTSRPRGSKEQDGRGYFFINEEQMEAEIKKNMYIDQGEFGGYLYGTRLSSIRDVIADGRICVLDVSPRALKYLQAPDFKPYIIFIAAPSVEALKVMHKEGKIRNNNNRKTDKRELFKEEEFIRTVKDSQEIERQYKGSFDEMIVNDDFEQTYRTICHLMDDQLRQHRWIPVEWNE